MRGDIGRDRLFASTPARDFRLHAAYDGGVSFGDDHGSKVPPIFSDPHCAARHDRVPELARLHWDTRIAPW
jgi:hypothetical protein